MPFTAVIDLLTIVAVVLLYGITAFYMIRAARPLEELRQLIIEVRVFIEKSSDDRARIHEEIHEIRGTISENTKNLTSLRAEHETIKYNCAAARGIERTQTIG